jgi:hypothetical protein
LCPPWRQQLGEGDRQREVGHKVGGGRVVEEVHDTGGDLMKVVVVSEVGWRWRSVWRHTRAEGNRRQKHRPESTTSVDGP